MNMIEVDVVAVADLCSRILPGMVARRRGAILNVASTAAFQPASRPGRIWRLQGVRPLLFAQPDRRATRHRGDGHRTVSRPRRHRIRGDSRPHQGGGRRVSSGFHVGDTRGGGKIGVDAMAKGRAVAIPGLANRVGAAVGYLTPRSVLVPILARPASRALAGRPQRAPRSNLPGRSPVSSPWANVVTPAFIVSTYPVAPCNSRVPPGGQIRHDRRIPQLEPPVIDEVEVGERPLLDRPPVTQAVEPGGVMGLLLHHPLERAVRSPRDRSRVQWVSMNVGWDASQMTPQCAPPSPNPNAARG